MVPAPLPAAIGADVLWCLGVGLLLGAARDLAGLALGNGRVLCFCWDVTAFALAAVALCGFAAGASASGVARWYMAAGMAAGAWGWHGGVSATLHALARGAVGLLVLPLRLISDHVFRPLLARCRALHPANFVKKRKKSAKKSQKKKNVLQKPQRILYN